MPIRTGRPFADYRAAFGRFVRVPFFLVGQITASAKMAATRRNVCRRCERFLRQRKLQVHKSASYQSPTTLRRSVITYTQFSEDGSNAQKLVTA